MAISPAHHQPSLPLGIVEVGRPVKERRERREQARELAEVAKCRLGEALHGRLKAALPGVSSQYVSQVTHGAEIGLGQFLLLVRALPTREQREHVLRCALEGESADNLKAIELEVAEAIEASGKATSAHLAGDPHLYDRATAAVREWADVATKARRSA